MQQELHPNWHWQRSCPADCDESKGEPSTPNGASPCTVPRPKDAASECKARRAAVPALSEPASESEESTAETTLCNDTRRSKPICCSVPPIGGLRVEVVHHFGRHEVVGDPCLQVGGEPHRHQRFPCHIDAEHPSLHPVANRHPLPLIAEENQDAPGVVPLVVYEVGLNIGTAGLERHERAQVFPLNCERQTHHSDQPNHGQRPDRREERECVNLARLHAATTYGAGMSGACMACVAC